MNAFQKIRLYFTAFHGLLRKEVSRLAAKKNPQIVIKSLQDQGIDIADDAIYFGDNIHIDMTRPSLIHIGSKTWLHNGFKIRTHDYATKVFLHKYNEFVPSSGRVWIGDNVWFGENVTVLKGAHIGNNCIIGINSVVMGYIPDGSVAAGCPAKVICTIEEYYQKRQEKCIEEAFEYARSIKSAYGREPVPADFWEEFPLFMTGKDIGKYPEIPVKKQLGEAYDIWVSNHKAPFKSFEEFIKAANI